MKRKTGRGRSSRREFLQGAVLAGGAATVAASAGAALLEPSPPAPAEAATAPAQGYRLTPHIRQYYEKARF